MILMKRGIPYIFITLILIFLISVPALASEVIFERREQTVLAKNVTYELNRQITSDGMLDVHILTVPLDNPYMYVGPVNSSRELGFKETAYSMLSGAGALAGVNGDFFGVAGAGSLALGAGSQRVRFARLTPPQTP